MAEVRHDIIPVASALTVYFVEAIEESCGECVRKESQFEAKFSKMLID